jgi:hypothetical protein
MSDRDYRRLIIFVEKSHALPEHRSQLNELIKAIRDNEGDGEQAKYIEETQEIAKADICILPMNWNYYVDNNRVHLVGQALAAAQEAGKPFVIFSMEDFTANIPFSGVVLFQPSAYQSRRSLAGNSIFALPIFIHDYLDLYCGGRLQVRKKSNKPVVGFCGQAILTRMDSIKREIYHRYSWIGYHAGWISWEPPPFVPGKMRNLVLNLLAASPLVQANFVIRKQYFSGYLEAEKKPLDPMRIEFIRNILDSDYTVCVRGRGNFSVRFYEVLSLGRIPIFVDTDCILPYDDRIDYRKYCVWVEPGEISSIAEKVAEFHASLPASDFEELQVECRKLWVNWLSANGFCQNFYKHFCMD